MTIDTAEIRATDEFDRRRLLCRLVSISISDTHNRSCVYVCRCFDNLQVRYTGQDKHHK